MTEARYISAAEVAKFLSISLRQVWRLAAEGRLPPPVKIGRSSRWDRRQIETSLRRTG